MARDRVGRAAQAAYVAAVAGLIAIVAIGLSLVTGGLLSIVIALGFLVMTLTIAPIMLGAYELGGVTPLWPARVALAGGIAGVLVWSILDAGSLLGLGGSSAVEGVALVVIGAWLVGAPLLAGPWLPFHLRWLGALTGVGFFLGGAGLLLGASVGPLMPATTLIYLFPLWAYLMGRVFRSRAGPPR